MEYCCDKFEWQCDFEVIKFRYESAEWMVRTGSGVAVLAGITYCPYCGARLPESDGE